MKFKVILGVLLSLVIFTAGCSNNAEKENEELNKKIAELEDTVTDLQNQTEQTDDDSESGQLTGIWVFEDQWSGRYIEISQENHLVKVDFKNSDLASSEGGHQEEYQKDSNNEWVEVSRNGEPTNTQEQGILKLNGDKLIFVYADHSEMSAVKLDHLSAHLDEFKSISGTWMFDTAEFQLNLEDQYLIMTGYDESDEVEGDIYMKILGTTENGEIASIREKVIIESKDEEITFDESEQVMYFKLEKADTLKMKSGSESETLTRK